MKSLREPQNQLNEFATSTFYLGILSLKESLQKLKPGFMSSHQNRNEIP